MNINLIAGGDPGARHILDEIGLNCRFVSLRDGLYTTPRAAMEALGYSSGTFGNIKSLLTPFGMTRLILNEDETRQTVEALQCHEGYLIGSIKRGRDKGGVLLLSARCIAAIALSSFAWAKKRDSVRAIRQILGLPEIPRKDLILQIPVLWSAMEKYNQSKPDIEILQLPQLAPVVSPEGIGIFAIETEVVNPPVTEVLLSPEDMMRNLVSLRANLEARLSELNCEDRRLKAMTRKNAKEREDCQTQLNDVNDSIAGLAAGIRAMQKIASTIYQVG